MTESPSNEPKIENDHNRTIVRMVLLFSFLFALPTFIPTVIFISQGELSAAYLPLAAIVLGFMEGLWAAGHNSREQKQLIVLFTAISLLLTFGSFMLLFGLSPPN